MVKRAPAVVCPQKTLIVSREEPGPSTADPPQELHHINECKRAQSKQARECRRRQPTSTSFPDSPGPWPWLRV